MKALVYDSVSGQALTDELERVLDILAGALFMEDIVYACRDSPRSRALLALYTHLEQDLRAWQAACQSKQL